MSGPVITRSIDHEIELTHKSNIDADDDVCDDERQRTAGSRPDSALSSEDVFRPISALIWNQRLRLAFQTILPEPAS